MFKNMTFWFDVFNKKNIGAVDDADGSDADCAFVGLINDKKASDQWLMTLQLETRRSNFVLTQARMKLLSRIMRTMNSET